MTDLKLIILDFDGVIVESNGIKDRAFDRLFRDAPRHHAEIMAYHMAHNHVDRHEKFRHIAESILNREATPRLMDEWARRFSEYTRQAIIECPFVPGAEDFLRKAYQRVPLYLASATPQDELDVIVDERRLRPYFRAVRGAPEKKKAMLNRILSEERAAPAEAVFVGDSPEDLQTAKEIGVSFIGRQSRSSFEGASFPVVRDLDELSRRMGL
jgi:phosphoglycolate phosphatase